MLDILLKIQLEKKTHDVKRQQETIKGERCPLEKDM
jgi:hypothetical protein